MLKRQHSLDQAGDPRRGVEMPEVGLQRAQGGRSRHRKSLRGTPGSGRRSRSVAERRGRAVRLDVADATWIDVGQRLGGGDDFDLAVDARRGVAGLPGAVVVDRRPPDDSVNGVTIGQRIGQALQDDDAGPGAAPGARRPRRTAGNGRPDERIMPS